MIDNFKSPTIPVSLLRKITGKLEKYNDEDEITFEFVLTSLFPTIWDNIQKYANDCYTSGYLVGLKERKENAS